MASEREAVAWLFRICAGDAWVTKAGWITLAYGSEHHEWPEWRIGDALHWALTSDYSPCKEASR